jgi:hypothetical protein
MTKQNAIAALHSYRRLIDQMQGHTFYCEDEDGVLRRWYPPRRPIIDKKGQGND